MKKIILIITVFFSISCYSAETSISLVEINNHWNNYVKTREYNGHWQTPEVTYKTKTGSSEDLAIIKYFDLISHGVPEDKLKIAIIAKEDKKQHAIVIFTHKNKKMVLDSEKSEIGELKDRKDIKKITSVISKSGVVVPNMGFSGESIRWNNIRNDFDSHVLFLKNLPKIKPKSAVHG